MSSLAARGCLLLSVHLLSLVAVLLTIVRDTELFHFLEHLAEIFLFVVGLLSILTEHYDGVLVFRSESNLGDLHVFAWLNSIDLDVGGLEHSMEVLWGSIVKLVAFWGHIFSEEVSLVDHESHWR